MNPLKDKIDGWSLTVTVSLFEKVKCKHTWISKNFVLDIHAILQHAGHRAYLSLKKIKNETTTKINRRSN